MKWSKTFYFLFWLLAGILVGTLVGNLCAGISGLSWLAVSQSMSFHPAFNLVVLNLDMNLSMSLNLAQVFCILAATFVYHHFWF